MLIVDLNLIRLRPDDFHETPGADPQAGCCGEGRLNAVPYPITPGMGVNLWGGSPLYENPEVFIVMDTTKSTSRRQGRFREGWSEGSPMANVRDDEQKPHTRLSPWASWHNTTKPTGSGGRVNAAFVHGKFTFLSGEICASRDRRFMSKRRKRFTRTTKHPAHPSAVDRCESRFRETQSRQQLMGISVAPCMATCRASTQKSADGIVVPGSIRDEGPNVEMTGASNELDIGVESERMSQISARHGIAFPRSGLSETSCVHCRFGFNPATAR